MTLSRSHLPGAMHPPRFIPLFFRLQHRLLTITLQGVLLSLFISITLPLHADSIEIAAALPAADEIHTFNVPAGPLDAALDQFAHTAGVNLYYDAALLGGLQSKGLSGNYTTASALSLLLAGSGIEAAPQPGGGYSLRKVTGSSAVTTLPPINVSANSLGETTEDTGSYTTGAMNTATPLSLSIRETPQSVSVLTTQQIQDQHLVTLDDAVRSLPGLVTQKGEYAGASGSFYARGFAINKLMLDGLPTSLSLGGSRTFNIDSDDLAIYDRIEVIRGSAGLTNGSGNPSAAINLVRKRPSAIPKVSIIGSIGRWDDYRIMVDAGGALNDSKTLRGRTVVSVQDKDNFYDNVNDKIQQIYGILELDLTPATLLTAGVHWRNANSNGVYAQQPVNEDGNFLNIPRSANFSNDFDYWDQRAVTAFTDLKHQFANGWSAKLSAIQRWQDGDLMFSGLDRTDSILYQYTQRYVLDTQQTSLNINANGPLSLLGRTHELAVGFSYQRFNYNASGGWADYSWTTDAPVVDPFNWNPHSVLKPAIDMTLWGGDFTTKELGTYAVARINLADPLKLIIGSRIDWYERVDHGGRDLQYKSGAEVTPYGGLIYDLNSNHSAYVGWTRIYQAPMALFANAYVNKDGKPLVPVTGSNLEAGIKGEYFDGRLNASVAVFQTKQQNRPVDDITGPNPCPGAPFGFCQRPAGEVKSEGMEFEVSGELTPGWQLHSGYTYVSAKYTKDKDPDNIGELFDPRYPKHLFKLATNYQLPGQLNRWRIGGNFHYQNGTYSNSDDRIKQSGYALLGFNLGYRFNKHLNAQLNINNVFDKHYYQNLGWTTGGTYPGMPRSYVLTLGWHL